MPLNPETRQCLWLTLDIEGQLRLYSHPDLDLYIPISLNQIVNLTTLNRLPKVGEMMPIWLRVSKSDYSKSLEESISSRTHIRRSVPTPMRDARPSVPAPMRDARPSAPEHNAPVCDACVPSDGVCAAVGEETTKRETTKESGTKKEEKKKRRKEESENTDTTETRVSAKKAVGAKGKENRSLSAAAASEGTARAHVAPQSPPQSHQQSHQQSPPPQAAPPRSEEEAKAAKNAFWSECCQHVGEYGRDYVTGFFGFWAETDRQGYMRWEREQFFNLRNRLARWNPDRGGEMRRAIAADVRRRMRGAERSEAEQRRAAIEADEARRQEAARAERNREVPQMSLEQLHADPEYLRALNSS